VPDYTTTDILGFPCLSHTTCSIVLAPSPASRPSGTMAGGPCVPLPQRGRGRLIFRGLRPLKLPLNIRVFAPLKLPLLCRRDLILAVANKDGGAHVDPVLDEKYANLSRGNSLAWRYRGPRGDIPLEGPEKAAVRQIAHEVLKTLNPKMSNRKPKMEGTIFPGNIMATTKPPQIPKVGRNDPCPCGSGKKYKYCHGKQ